MEPNSQLSTTVAPSQIMSYDDMEKMARHAASSGLFGLTNPAQAMCLFALCQSEGLNPLSALRRYHIIEGKPSMRADAIQGEFQARGHGVLFHVRTDELVCATYFEDKKTIDDGARKRGEDRFEKLLALESEKDAVKRAKLMLELSKLSRHGEETVLRTFKDALDTGLAYGKVEKDEQGKIVRERDGTPKREIKTNWQRNKRAMLTARNVSEGVRIIDPGLIAGIYTPEEQQDIAEQEREFVHTALTDGVKPADRRAIEAMIEQHLEEAKTASPARKSGLQGLASELRCTLADMEAHEPGAETEAKLAIAEHKLDTAAKAVETTVLPPEKKEQPKPKPTPTPKPVSPAPLPMPETFDWREVECHIGKAQGPMLGKKMGDIIKMDRTEKAMKGIVGFFETNAKGRNIEPERDSTLWEAYLRGYAAWKAAQKPTEPEPTPETPKTPQAAPEPKSATPTPLAPETPPPATVAVTDWREFVLDSRNPNLNGKKLGELPTEDIVAIKTDYLDKIDVTKATLKQKLLAAMVNMALAELTPTKTEEPTAPHTAALLEFLRDAQIDHKTFLAECGKVGFIGTAKTIDEVSAEDVKTLLSDKPSVIAQCDVVP